MQSIRLKKGGRKNCASNIDYAADKFMIAGAGQEEDRSPKLSLNE